MTRHKFEPDIIGRIAGIAGVILLAGFFFPPVRRTLAEFGSPAAGLALLAILGLLGFGLYRLVRQHTALPPVGKNPFASSDEPAEPAWNGDKSGSARPRFGPVLRRRYPWRH